MLIMHPQRITLVQVDTVILFFNFFVLLEYAYILRASEKQCCAERGDPDVMI